MSLQRLRTRLPLLVVLLMFLMLLVAVGTVCACASDHPMQGIERTIAASMSSGGFVALPVAHDWPTVFAVLVAGVLLLPSVRFGYGRGSPPVLQRFRF